jgi:uncharacterized protein YdeI (YjbR/CyaY-like superfamily)
VDEALCFGWIDGIRRSLGEHAYCIRFTPRRPGSGWSAVNRRKVEALIAAGRMAPAGLAAWRARPARDGARSSSGPGGASRLPPAMVRRFRATPEAWAWFSARPPGYRRTVVRWVTSARQQVTRERRLGVLIAAAAEGTNVPPLRGLERKQAAPGRVATAPARRGGRRRP